MTDRFIIEGLRSNSEDRNKVIRFLCNSKELRDSIFSLKNKYGGDQDTFQMVLSDVILAFSKKVFFDKEFELSRSVFGYLYGMARYKWIDYIKQKGDISELELKDIDQYEENEISGLELLLKNERKETFNKVLSQMRKNCKELLMYWAGGYKMKEIAKLLDYKSDGMVRKKKSECMKELKLYCSNNQSIKRQLLG